MLRYALYARKSKDDKSGLIKSIQDQLDVWHTLAAERDLTIAREYEENKTAKIPGGRPVYARMLAEIAAGEVDAILVWHINRLARNMEEAGRLAQMLINAKIKEIRTPHWTYRPGDNILPLLLEQGMSTQYSLDLSEAVIRGTNSMVAEGGWPHQAKVGYLNARDPLNPKKGILIKDPERFDLLRKGFDLLLTGSYTVRHVVDTMNQQWHFRTRPTPSRPGGPLSRAAAHDIFRNAFYAGFTTHNGMQRKGNHEPMITVAEYNRLQDILHRRSRSRRRKHEFTYTGMMRCGYCGLQITAEQVTKESKQLGNTQYIYYHCSDAYLKCSKKGIGEKQLEAEILRHLQRITIAPELAAIALETIWHWQGQAGNRVEDLLIHKEKALQDAEAQRRSLLDMMVRNLITDEALYKEKDAQLMDDCNQLRRGIEQTRSQVEQMRMTAKASLNYLQYARDHFLVAEPTRKREIASVLASEYVLRGAELSVTIHPLLAEFVKFVEESGSKLEPGGSGSSSQDRTFFSASIRGGRGAESQIEPQPNLIEALTKCSFPELFAYA